MKVQLSRLVKLRREEEIVSKPNTGSNVEIAMPQTFDRSSEKVRDFVMVCKLYLRIRMRKAIV